MRRIVCAIAAVAAIAVAASVTAPAQQGPSPPAYRPGLGDIMTTTIQPRHIKLGLAGREKNWTYAAYEVHELEEAFDRASIHWPQWQRLSIVEMIETSSDSRCSISGRPSRRRTNGFMPKPMDA